MIDLLPLFIGTFGLSAAAIAGITGVAGVGASLYGASKNAKAQKAAMEANAKSVADTNQLNYQRWLESQGVGQNGEALNTWLPRYAKLNTNFAQPGGRRFRRIAGAQLVPSLQANGAPSVASFSAPASRGVPPSVQQYLGGKTVV